MVVTDNANILSQILAAADNNKVNVKSLQTKVPTLEDVFLHLTGRGLRN
jgi:ABC-2 type transport system ATP-binding protein